MAEKNKRRTSDNIPDICPEGQQKKQAWELLASHT